MCPLRPVCDGTETAVPEDRASSPVEMQTIRDTHMTRDCGDARKAAEWGQGDLEGCREQVTLKLRPREETEAQCSSAGS